MYRSKGILLLFILLICHGHVMAQLGKKLKDKINKASNAIANPTDFARTSTVDLLKESKAELDSSSFGYAIAFSDNAGLFEDKEKGEKVQAGVILLLEKSDEKEPVDVANNYLDAGEIAYASNKYKSAEVSFHTSKLLFETNNLTYHINYPRLIADLGLLNHTMGRYSRSQEYTENSLELRKDMLGETSIAYGVSLNNLAMLEKDLGQYVESEVHLNEAISIIENAVDENDQSLAIIYNNKAMLYQALGRYDNAVELMNQSIAISEATGNTKSNNHQRLLTNLAILYQLKGDYNQSEETYLEVIELKEKRLGKNHPDYAHMLINLASLYVEMGKDEEVEQLLTKAGDIYESKFGKSHPSYANYQSDLGNFYKYKGRTDEAEVLLREALVNRSKLLGENHPDYVQSQEDYALILWQQGKRSEAAQYYKPAMEKSLGFIQSFFPSMSEAEKTRYWDKLNSRFQRFYSFAVDAAVEDDNIVEDLFKYRNSTKAIILSSSQKLRESILTGDDEALKENYLQWIDTKNLLAGYYTYSEQELIDEKVNLDSIENVANEKERYLSSNSTLFSSESTTNAKSSEEVANYLESDEALVDILQIQHFERVLTNKSSYYALVLRKGSTKPTLVNIGNSETLDDKYYKYYRNSIRLKNEDIYSYDQFWKPVSAHLNGINKIYLSNDGIYHQVSLSTLKDPAGQYLIDTYHPILITNVNDFINLKSNSTETKITSAYLIGYPEYGNASVVSPLPGTKKEIADIKKILDSQGISTVVYGDNEATESNIKSINNPDILHIATHGFFLQDHKLNSDKVFGVDPEVAKDNPLLRSGLMFNGAALTLKGIENEQLSFNDNGVLTGYEALNLNLDNTKMVVLSACETGLGDIKSGEGVYGLQRSFLVAGVNSIIMSLWKVDDTSTQILMSSFYQEFAKSNDVEAAFKKAQSNLKSTYAEPYYWGAFVLVRK